MKIIETSAEKKSFIITLLMFIVLFLFIFLYKFQPVTSQLEMSTGGEIAIRFGQDTQGFGTIQRQEEVVKQETSEENPKPETTEIKTTEKIAVSQKNTPTDITVQKEKDTDKKHVSEKEVKKPSKSTSNTLESFLAGKKQNGDKSAGNSQTQTSGNQGAIDGSLYSNSYYGSGTGSQGFGGGSSWGLNGRSLSSYNTFKPDCNEVGTVVIQVTVNKGGSIINTKLDLSGTTNSAPCLVDAAMKTARSFKWKADNNAPDSQIGFIKIKFNVGN